MTAEAEGQNAPYLRVYLGIWGAFDPGAFGETVGLEADESRRRGERNVNLDLPRYARWQLHARVRHSFDVDEMVTELLARFPCHQERLRDTVAAWGLGISLSVVAE